MHGADISRIDLKLDMSTTLYIAVVYPNSNFSFSYTAEWKKISTISNSLSVGKERLRWQTYPLPKRPQPVELTSVKTESGPFPYYNLK